MKVIVYFGHHKVGSTALQAFFSRNHLQLLRDGILYPAVETEALSAALAQAVRGHHKGIRPTLNVHEPHNALAFKLMSQKGPQRAPRWHPQLPSVPQMVKALRMQAQFLEPHTVVLCSEVMSNFGRADPELIDRVRSIFPDAEYEFYCVLRRPDEYLVSWHGQRLKFGDKLAPLSDGAALHYVNTIHFDYRTMLEPWLTRAAGAKVHVRNYADVLATGGSVQDFAVCTGLQLPRKLVTDKRANTSFPRAAMEIVRRGNHELVGDDVQDLKHFFLTSAFSPVPNADVEMFGDAVRADLFDRFAPIHDFLTEVNGGNRFFPYIEEMLQTRPVPEQEATRQLLEQIDPARLPGAELRAFIERLKSEHVGAAI